MSAFKDYNDFASTTGHIAGNYVNDHIHSSAFANSGIAASTVAFAKLGNAILHNTSCQFEQANWMFKQNKFNVDNVQISRTYCSRITALDSLPTFSHIQAIEKDFVQSRMMKSPEELYIYDNRKFGDLSTFDKITHVMNHAIYGTQAITGSFYDIYNTVFDAVGNGVSYVTTKSLLKAQDWFKTENTSIAQNAQNLGTNLLIELRKVFSEEIYWNERLFSMPYTGTEFQLMQNDNSSPNRFKYHYSSSEPRYFEWSVSFGTNGLNVSIAGNPLAATDREHNFNINGFKGTCYSEGHISHWKYQQAARVDDDFLDIHVRTKNYHGSKARNAAEAEYYRQAKIRLYQVTGLPHELVNPNRKKPTIRYEKAVENLLIKILMNKWMDEKKLTQKQREYYEAILRQDKDVITITINQTGKKEQVYEVPQDSKDFDYEQEDPKSKQKKKYKKYVKKELTYFDKHKHEDIITYVKKWYNYWQTGKDDACDPGDITAEDKKEFFNEQKKAQTEGNNALTSFENAQKALEKNHQGNYTRTMVIYDINKEIVKYNVSAENVFAIGESASTSVGACTIAYADLEYEHFRKKGVFGYSSYKVKQLCSFYAQNFASSAATNHVSTSIGLMSFTDKWSDDFMNDWVAPNVGAAFGTGISAMTCYYDNKFKHMNTGERIQMIGENTLRANISYIIKFLFPKSDSAFYTAITSKLEQYGLGFMTGIAPSVGILLANRVVNWVIYKDKCDYELEDVVRMEKTKQINAKQQIVSDVMENCQGYWEKQIAIKKMLIS